MTDLFTAIGNFGFPVVVAGYLLFRFENKIEKLDISISGTDGLIAQIKILSREIKELRAEVKKR